MNAGFAEAIADQHVQRDIIKLFALPIKRLRGEAGEEGEEGGDGGQQREEWSWMKIKKDRTKKTET